MRVLLTGASGFLGQHLALALASSGHVVVCAGRQPANADTCCDSYVDADFARDRQVAAWLPKLQGIEAVINSVGILHEHGSQTFLALHVQAPCPLFDACVIAGVDLVSNISALVADDK